MPGNRDFFGPGSNPERRLVRREEDLIKHVEHLRGLRQKIVLTSGTFDLLHIGHMRYLEQAAFHGDILIVGVDSDEKTRKRKGEDRPVVPESERIEMLTHSRYVDLVYVKEDSEERWGLIKLVCPDVLIATAETYTVEEVKELEGFCGKVEVLTPQATTSTSAKIRRLQIGATRPLIKKLIAQLQEFLPKEGDEE
jgi:D-beta-D-heptose 7-phosphate kinase/D-beta-D-heptose 1-phosphate adenosyltransferase